MVLIAIPLALNVGCSESSDEGATPAPEPYAANICVGEKQAAAATFCKAALDALAIWEIDKNTGALDTAIANAQTALDDAWGAAETGAVTEGADCSNLALTSEAAGAAMGEGIDGIIDDINDGLDLDQSEEAQCGADLITAASDYCDAVLAAESTHISDLWADTDGAKLEAAITAADAAFSSAWAAAITDCPTNATEEGIGTGLETLTGELVRDTIVSPGLLNTEYTALEPESTVEYLGEIYEPQCMQGNQYRYFGRRGSVNKLLMYYMGGGACWDGFTCGDAVPDVTPTCNTTADLDLNEGNRGGFGDLSNDANPFKDWHIVFVTYCSCDIHFGDVTQDYPGVTVQHKGYHNSKVAERWAREHFYNPEEIFVTGTSAGAYGAWFNAPLLHEVWPASQIHVLADAGNGVITPDFLRDEFSNWNFVDNLPDIPGVEEAITSGDGMPAYTKAVAEFFPDTNWAHYSTMFDGGNGGQTGFYHLMVNDIFNRAWWESSCAWSENALAQSESTFEAVPDDNYRYYFGTGSRHGMFYLDKVYTDTTAGVPTIVDWVDAMLKSRPGAPDDGWTNVLCDDCSLTLEGDPAPNPLAAPFEQQGNDVVINCPPPQ